MKKMFLSLLVLVSAIAIIGCNTKNGNTKLEALEEPENVYAISVVNGIEQILSTNTGIYLMNDSADVKEDIHNLDLLLGLLNEELFNVEEKISDNDEFEKLIEITINNENHYSFYFNEKLIEEDNEDDEFEAEYKIEGIIIFNDLIFNAVGIKEVEIEDDEEEFELELKVSIDEENYTVIKYEIETESEELEREYKLETFENGKLVRKVKIDFELEDNELELEVEIEENDKSSKYELKHFTKKDKAQIKYEIEEGSNKFEGIINVSVIIEEDTVRYIFE